MNCLIVAATINEIKPFLDNYRNGRNGMPDPLTVDVLITGIGLTASTWAITKQLQLKRPGMVIQAGVAGSFDKQLAVGTVVLIKRDTIADLGVVENKKLNSVFDMGLASSNRFPYKKGWLVNPGNKLSKASKMTAVTGISVNQISTSRQSIQFYKEKFEAATESMEGAALHYVCLMEKIPFLQVRGISNYIGERNKKNWKMKEAILNLNIQLNRLLELLSDR